MENKATNVSVVTVLINQRKNYYVFELMKFGTFTNVEVCTLQNSKRQYNNYRCKKQEIKKLILS